MPELHSFNVGDAEKYGIHSAVILFDFRFWLRSNLERQKNIFEERVWTYNTLEFYSRHWPYMSESQIYRNLKSLKNNGVVLFGRFNKHNYDRTNWYTIDEPEFRDLDEKPISQKRKKHFADSKNGDTEIEKSISRKRDNDTRYSPYSIPNTKDNIVEDSENPDEESKNILIKEFLDKNEVSEIDDRNVLLAVHIWKDVDDLRPDNKITQSAKLKSWVNPVRLMVEQDDRSLDEIWELWQRVQRDNFWKSNILSTSKLREKYDQLQIKLNSNGSSKNIDKIVDSLY